MEQEIVEKPDLAQLATVQKSKTKGTNPVIKKKIPMKMNWGLFALGAAGILSWLWNKKKKELVQAQAYKDRLLPPVKQQITLPAETNTSPDARLRGMGINTGVPGAYQKTGENYKEIR